MHEAPPDGGTRLAIPFSLHGESGVVHVSVAPILDGVRAGFDILAGLPFAADATVGYPAMSARVEYDGTGYRTLMGWVQTIRTVRTTTGRPVDDDRCEVDLAPAFGDLDSPFFASGSTPSVVDAPARNLNGADRLAWTADTFLTTLPLRSRREPIRRLASFRWGYEETADPDHAPTLLPTVVTGAPAWAASVDLLRSRFPSWTFDPA
ncbi:hypothetical protein [Kineosporia sp. A_224]|uniref:hypothetical protein n=1 Tax=Kineosporia sp. A_224 TaxID=1962180 RepID=UPI000B4C18A8|nr:hypothetical protein [Kineosporia sp. A_224]